MDRKNFTVQRKNHLTCFEEVAGRNMDMNCDSGKGSGGSVEKVTSLENTDQHKQHLGRNMNAKMLPVMSQKKMRYVVPEKIPIKDR